MLSNIDHINIVVTDLGRSIAFYQDLLGFRETMRARLEGEWIESITGVKGVVADCVYLELPSGPRLELLQFLSPAIGEPLAPNSLPNTLGLRHMAFRVDDIDAEYQRLEGLGVRFVGPPQAVPTGLVKHSTGRKRLCYFHDPDGVLLEIAEFQPNPT
jgi:catechol 2,3-dioxygenase-like lactoylglutathione lyase family enzyme